MKLKVMKFAGATAMVMSLLASPAFAQSTSGGTAGAGGAMNSAFGAMSTTTIVIGLTVAALVVVAVSNNSSSSGSGAGAFSTTGTR